MHGRSHFCIKLRFAILRPKDDVENDFAKRLRHGAYDQASAENESRFQPRKLSGLPQATNKSAPLALNRYVEEADSESFRSR
jgi:hypothetical protein